MRRIGPVLLLVLAPSGCSSPSVVANPPADGSIGAEAEEEGAVQPKPDGGTDASMPPPGTKFCDLPGSIRYTTDGVVTVPGGAGEPIDYVRVPNGFCVHYFGNVGNARQMRFAPGGDLFVASPTSGTTSSGGQLPNPVGESAIIVLPDDDHDGVADANLTFLSSLPSTQGLLFANDHFYYQDGTKILRVPFERGDRSPSGESEVVADIEIHFDALHWPKTLDQADDGTIYVGNGGGQQDTCMPGRPFLGGILKLDGSPGGSPVAKGFRNPIAVRCQHGHDRCYALELGKDYSNVDGGREKLVPIRQDDDWGFPCCLGKDLPDPGSSTEDCSTIAEDDVKFYIGSTPFGVDFEPGKWAAPYKNAAFVALHGIVGSFMGARIVAIGIDPDTGLPLPGDDLNQQRSNGAMSDFATGWGDGSAAHGPPTAVSFAADGRLFVANDHKGTIVWIAPLDLEM